ncbi:MAG: alpha/beta fold hydrolase [Anaerolinea sp.]|nr:alpha/beta fold hydrolase [Anaerolinea sp.]
MPRLVMYFAFIALLLVSPLAAQESVPRFEPAPCPFNYPARYHVECGYVVTPEVHSDPDGAAIRVMVAIFPARSSTPAEPVIYLQGGPGSSGMARFAGGLDGFGEAITNEHAYILLDQRGIGHSLPSLDCPEIQAMHDNALGGAACHERLIAEGVNIPAFNTVESAGDVIAVADALGYETISLLGSSYGSTLAFTVMRHYPERLRAVILEGVTPPEVDLMTSWADSMQGAWAQMVADCASSRRCFGAYPNLDGMLTEVVTRLNAEPLEATIPNPVTGEDAQITLTGTLLLQAMQSAFYRYDYIPQIPLLIAALYTGNLEPIMQLGTQLTAQSSIDTQSEGAFYVMRCSDDVLTTTPEADAAAQAAVEPMFTEAFGDTYSSWEPTCALWGTQLDPVENTPVISDIPTLMLNGAYDPVTPAKWADAAAENLIYGYSFTFPESTHGVYPDRCATGILRAFLSDPYTAPDATCIEEYIGVGFRLPPQ